MATTIINLRNGYGFQFKDIRDLLEDLKPIDFIKIGDDVVIKLPTGEQVSDLALAIIWTKLRAFKNFPCQKNLNYSQKSKDHFDERHFFDQLVGERNPGLSKKVPFHFDTFNINENEDETANKVGEAVHASIENLPLGQEAKIHILELVSNAFHHSEALSPVGCISKFTGAGSFEFCIADQGRGVRKSFSSNINIWPKYSGLRAPELIEQATEQYVTCNPKTAPQYSEHKNSGLGLYFLKEFCKHHNGHTIIISGTGYYYIDASRIKKNDLQYPWQGTVVSFRANLMNQMNNDYTVLKQDWMDSFEGVPFSFKKK